MSPFRNPRSLLLLLCLIPLAACSGGATPTIQPPPSAGFFLESGDGTFLELSRHNGLPVESGSGIPKSADPLPRIALRSDTINPELLQLTGQAGRGEEAAFTTATQENGVHVLIPTAALSPSVYCFVLVDPQVISGSRSHWCFSVGGVALSDILVDLTPTENILVTDPLDLSDAPMIETDSGLIYQDDVVGDGSEALPGSLLTVHYTGWLADGTPFDSSIERGEPYDFQLGVGAVIPGWDLGLAGMQVGGVRILHIPPQLAYGAQGFPPVIPPDSTLVFQVLLLDVVFGTEQLQP